MEMKTTLECSRVFCIVPGDVVWALTYHEDKMLLSQSNEDI